MKELSKQAPDQSRKGRNVGAPMSMRAGKTRFRRHMRVVREISDDLYALLKSLPNPDKEEMEEALSPIGGITPDMYFLGALNAVHFLISEAVLLAQEERRFARSRAASYIVDHRVMQGLENVARWRRPPTPAAENETEEEPE